MDHPLFLLGLCLLLAHQMDALRLAEWRVLPPLDRIPEAVAPLGFIAVHVPICLVMLWGVFFTVPGGLNRAWVTGLDVFFVAHLGLHLVLLRHPRNPFRSAFSWTLIAGAGLCGAADLAVTAG